MDLVIYPDPLLRKRSLPVEDFGPELEELGRSMLEKMYGSRGVGLAAPQVGMSRRLFVMNPTGEADKAEGERVVINPVVLKRQGSIPGEEGCLSLPAIYAEVTRPEVIEVAYHDFQGNKVETRLEDFDARVFLHELDHLEGILFVNRLEPAEKILVRKKLKQLEAQFPGNRART